MSDSCRVCQGKEFSNENCERICINCGDVQEELADDRLCMLPDNEAIVDNFRNKNLEANQRLTGRIRGETNSSETKRRICREKLLEEMRKTVRQLIKHASAVDETMSLVSSTFQAYGGRLLTSKKLGLVGACIYYISAKNQLGISLTDICKALGIKMKIISVCLKQVRQLCPKFEYERLNMKDLVRRYIETLSSKYYYPEALESCNSKEPQTSVDTTQRPKDPQSLIDSKDKNVLFNRVMLLIELFEAMHPYNQPTPHSLIVAVVYHAWRSLDTFKIIGVNLIQNLTTSGCSGEKEDAEHLVEKSQTLKMVTRVKHSISFEKFCQICNLKYSSNGYKIVSKLQASMLLLGKHLGNVNKVNLPWYLKDIIDNSPHLLQEHSRSEISSKTLVEDETRIALNKL